MHPARKLFERLSTDIERLPASDVAKELAALGIDGKASTRQLLVRTRQSTTAMPSKVLIEKIDREESKLDPIEKMPLDEVNRELKELGLSPGLLIRKSAQESTSRTAVRSRKHMIHKRLSSNPIFGRIGTPTKTPGVSILRSGEPGPRVGLMGMLHGNELAGVGLWHLAQQLGQPARGKIYLIVGHPMAMTHPSGPVRYIERDINRMFSDDGKVALSDADYDRCLELRSFLKGLDVLIDIHSTSSPSDPFAILSGADPMGARLSSVLPISQVYGVDSFCTGTAASWVVRHGGSAISIEVGQHNSQRGPEVAHEMALRILHQLGMVSASGPDSPREHRYSRHHVAVVSRVQTVHPSFTYSRPLANFDHLQPGELIGWDEEAIYRAPDINNAVLFKPASIESIRDGTNTDAFYIGVELNFLPKILDQIRSHAMPTEKINREILSASYKEAKH